MPKRRFKAEQIVVLLRQIEVSMSQGKAAPVVGKPEFRSRVIIAGGRNTVVCTENLNPHVMVMNPAKDEMRLDASDPLNRARGRQFRTEGEKTDARKKDAVTDFHGGNLRWKLAFAEEQVACSIE